MVCQGEALREKRAGRGGGDERDRRTAEEGSRVTESESHLVTKSQDRERHRQETGRTQRKSEEARKQMGREAVRDTENRTQLGRELESREEGWGRRQRQPGKMKTAKPR